MTMFLTDDEIHELTGYKRNADQRRWLTARGWRFEVSAGGKPIVSRQHAEAMLSGARIESERTWKPNRAALVRAA
jgi:hypothetical protein